MIYHETPPDQWTPSQETPGPLHIASAALVAIGLLFAAFTLIARLPHGDLLRWMLVAGCAASQVIYRGRFTTVPIMRLAHRMERLTAWSRTL